jgi:hypothetical protein
VSTVTSSNSGLVNPKEEVSLWNIKVALFFHLQ